MKTRLSLKVRANAPATRFAGEYNGGWKLQVAAAPVDGKANEAILKFLSKVAGLPVSQVRIIAGATSSTKVVEFEGVNAADLSRAILEAHGSRTDTGSAAARKS